MKQFLKKHKSISIPLIFIAVSIPLMLVINVIQHIKEQRASVVQTFDKKNQEITIYDGGGNNLITFEVTIPSWTPREDRIYVRVDGFNATDTQGIPMTKTGDYTYIAKYKTSRGELRYRYNRNDSGYATDEQLEPEELNATRTVLVESEEIINDTVKGWRWLYNPTPTANISDFKPTISDERKNSFNIGVSLLDFYNPNFTKYIPETLDRLKEKGYEYLGIAYSPHLFTSADPLEVSTETINSHSQKELDYLVSEAKKRELKIMLMPWVETDPGNLEEIDKVLRSPHEDQWYRDFVAILKSEMVEVAKYAEKNKLEVLAPSNSWLFVGNPTIEQARLMNELINDYYLAIKKEYSGTITSDFYMEDEWGIYDYYKQMDWIGDKWWGSIANTRETTLESMKTEAEKVIKEKYQPIYDKYKKPIFLNQLAFASHDGGAGGVDVWNEGEEVAEWFPKNELYPLDFQEQADAYEAVFQAIYDDPIFSGVFAFGYGYWDFQAKSPSIRSKPSESVWEKWIEIFN